MKIQCFLPCLNEADILPHVLRHMSEQGVSVHVIDGYSTDGSAQALDWWEQMGLDADFSWEQFPVPDDGVWNCRRMLGHIEELAAASHADWCGLSDADEWRRSSRAGETLAEGIARADVNGANCIDHRVFAFWPHDDNWDGSTSPEEYFRHYNEDDPICKLPQRKFWRNTGRRVDLVSTGGHDCIFPGRRIFPERFVMKHYPFRSSTQAKAKLRERLERRCLAEHAAGWGVHYDAYAKQEAFWLPPNLSVWADPATPLP